MKFVSVLALFLAACFYARAAGTEKFYFSNLTANNGLSNNTIKAIAQDGDGLIWIGTREGLDRYDGAHLLQVMRIEGGITALKADRHGNIWAGTTQSLHLFSPDAVQLRSIPVQEVTAIERLDDRTAAIGTGKGLLLFEEGKQEPDTAALLNVRCLCRAEDMLYIGTDRQGLYVMSCNSRSIRKFESFGENSTIQEIYHTKAGSLIVGTEGDGIYIFDGSSLSEHYTSENSELLSNYIRALGSDSFGRLWIGSVKGLNILSDKRFISLTHSPFEDGCLSDNSVRCIYCDRQDGMWLGTYHRGVNYWHPRRNHFDKITVDKAPDSLSGEIVSCIREDGNYIYIGTNGTGLDRYDKRTGRIKVLSDMTADIKALSIDRDCIYVGSHAAGLARIDKADGRLTRCAPGSGLPANDVYALLDLDDGRLLVGSLDGLFVYDKRKDSLEWADFATEELKRGRIMALYKDSSGRIWAGCSKTAFCGDTRYEIGSIVTSFFESSEGDIWVASRGGLYRLRNGEVRRYGKEDGLADNITHAVEEDSWGRLWISTDRGLCSLDPNSGQIRCFTVADGLPGNQFNDYAHCRTAEGQLWFGGMNGIALFVPENFSDNIYAPRPLILSLQSGGETFPTDEALKLGSGNNTFEIHFAVPNYLSWENNSFEYMLEGYDSGWLSEGREGIAAYTKVPHGKYVFKVRACNSDGIWSPGIAELKITVLPKWYQTIAAKILFLLAAIGLLLLILNYIRQRNAVRQEQELIEMKTRFFISISQELKTPLTLISAPVKEMLERSDDKWMRKQLKYMDRNAHRLQYLVDQLVDHHRAELGMFKLHVRSENLQKILKENYDYFASFAATKHLRYTFEAELGESQGWCDAEFIELIMNNLLSNAFKYTDKGAVSVHCELGEGGILSICISDSGIGISKDQLGHIFDKYYHGLSLVKRIVELHHGQISVESEAGQGSSFTVVLPVDESAYSQEEKKAEKTEEKPAVRIRREKEYSPEEEIVEPENIEEARASILIVEHDKDFSGYLRNGLRRHYKVSIAEDSAQARQSLSEKTPDLIIMDTQLPDSDALKLCREIRRRKETTNIPVIMISADNSEETQLEALHNGANDFVAKPFSMSVISAKISGLLRTIKKISDSARGDTTLKANTVAYKPADEEFMDRAIKVVRRNMDNVAFSTEDLAREMNVSRSNLHLKIKSITGQSALDLVKKVRFDYACKLLRDGRWTINQISDKVGFASASYFATSFKKHTGMMPSEYIKQKQTQN